LMACTCKETMNAWGCPVHAPKHMEASKATEELKASTPAEAVKLATLQMYAALLAAEEAADIHLNCEDCMSSGKDAAACEECIPSWDNAREQREAAIKAKAEEKDAELSRLRDENAALAAAFMKCATALDGLYCQYEEGVPCYEDPEEESGYLGNAVKPSDEDENFILEALESAGVETCLRAKREPSSLDPAAILAAHDRALEVKVLREAAEKLAQGHRVVNVESIMDMADWIERGEE